MGVGLGSALTFQMFIATDMAWYAALFDCVYESSVGAKVLASIESSVRTGNFRGAFLCYLAVRKVERVATSKVGVDAELAFAIANLELALEAIGHPLSAQDRDLLKQIFSENGFYWSSGDSAYAPR